jgi:hypothetical protein
LKPLEFPAESGLATPVECYLNTRRCPILGKWMVQIIKGLTWTNVVADGSNLSLEPHFEHFVSLIEKRQKKCY